jgi:hypothetical protein
MDSAVHPNYKPLANYKWLEQNQSKVGTSRYFGFNNRDPASESDNYGYEIWAEITAEVKENGQMLNSLQVAYTLCRTEVDYGLMQRNSSQKPGNP